MAHDVHRPAGRHIRRTSVRTLDADDYETRLAAATAPPNPAATATLRRTGCRSGSRQRDTRLVGSGSRVWTFGGMTPVTCAWQFSTTDTRPAAPRLWPRAPLWEYSAGRGSWSTTHASIAASSAS